MPYFRAPAERPRQAKRFLTSREVEDIAASGQTQIVHQEDMVITDAARETAHDLGVRIVQPDDAKLASPRTSAPPPQTATASQVAPVIPARAPAAPVAPVKENVRAAAAGNDPLVQALVQAMRTKERTTK